MSRLYLMRHARAAWPAPGVRDFDRSLDTGAAADAETLGLAMRANEQMPQKVICSSSRRTRETWTSVAQGLEMDADAAEFSDTLYCSDVSGYIDLIRRNADVESILLIGHNPMLEDLAFSLSKRNADGNFGALEDGFAACGLATIEFDGPLSQAAPGKGCLRMYMTPDDL